MKKRNNLQLVASVALLSSVAATSFSASADNTLSKKTGVEFKVSGQVNRAIVFADNGADSDTLFVDNTNSGSRIRLVGKVGISPSLSAGVNIETQYEDNKSFSLDIDSPDNDNVFTSRKRELWFKGGFGKFTLGKGDGAANNTSEADLSGTWIANNSGDFLHSGLSFADVAGNKVIKMKGAFSNFDGLSRNNRLRYDTPAYGPVSLAVSGGQDRAELGAFLSHNLGGGSKVKATLGYVNNNAADFNQLGLSASYLTAGGFNVTAHYGERDNVVGADSDGAYIKVGQKIGPHNLSVGYHKVNSLAAAGDTAKRTNVSWVYNLSKGIELFADYQNATLDRNFGPALGDIDTFAVGSRVKF